MTIAFYGQKNEYAWLSNFSPHPFALDGKSWATVEHYFQAAKFPGTDYSERIRLAKTPSYSKQLGRSRSVPIRPDWEAVKEDVMRRALRAKFTAHRDLLEMLLSTGEEELVENSPSDSYWGCGKLGNGRNRLGHLLTELRSALRADAATHRAV